MSIEQVIGFDCSSKAVHMVGLNLDGSISIIKSWKSKSKGTEIRFRELFAQLDDYLCENKENFLTSIATIENPIYVQNAKSTIAITNVIAGVKIARTRHKINYFGIENTSWKKDVLGNGRAKKEEIAEFTDARWPEAKLDEQDYKDAACISLWGVMRFGRPIND